MAVRPIIIDHHHKVLRGKAKRVGRIDDFVRRLIDDMIDTMREAPGVGLAAPQIGVSLRVIVVEHEDTLYTVINPEIANSSGEVTDEEGCLSAPHWQGPVTRATSLLVKGRDRAGKEVRIRADGWLARIFQHECDHLEGTLFLDRVEDRAQIHWVDPDAPDAPDAPGASDTPRMSGGPARSGTLAASRPPDPQQAAAGRMAASSRGRGARAARAASAAPAGRAQDVEL